MVVVLHLMDALLEVRVVQSLDAGQASAGLWVQYSSEEADSSLWGCTAGPDLAQQRVLHSSLIHFCCCDSIDLQHKKQQGHIAMSDNVPNMLASVKLKALLDPCCYHTCSILMCNKELLRALQDTASVADASNLNIDHLELIQTYKNTG